MVAKTSAYLWRAVFLAGAFVLLASAPAVASPLYQSGFGSSSGPGRLEHPADVAVDAEGNVWIADHASDRIVEYNASGEYVSQFGSTGFSPGYLEQPSALAIDGEGNIWVADTNNYRVDEFRPTGEFVQDIEVAGPEGIAVDSEGHIWASATRVGRLEEFNSSGKLIRQVSEYGSGEEQLEEPTGLDFGPEGDVWVTDWQLNRVKVFGPSGEFVRQIGEFGAGPGQFEHPDAIDVDTEGTVLVGDEGNTRIDVFNQKGEFVEHFGNPVETLNFVWPFGIASSGNHFWVTNPNAHTVQKWRTKESATPACQAGSATTDVNQTLVLEAGALGCEGEKPLEYEISSGPEHGEITGFSSETGALSYVPQLGYYGSDSFTFKATNALGSSAATLFRLGVGKRPSCEEDLGESTPVAESLPIDLSCVGTAPLEYEIVSAPEFGEIVEFDPATGHLVYEPQPEFAGYDEFSFAATNVLGSSPIERVRIGVGEAPSCESAGGGMPVGESLPVQLKCKGTSPLTFEVVEYPEHGEISEFDTVAGTLTYTPYGEYEGPDSFEFRASNALGTSSRSTFHIDVGDQGPVASYSFNEGSGTVAHDESRGHDGTVEGTQWTGGINSFALHFSATEESLVTVPDAEDLRLEDFTIEASVRPEESLPAAAVLTKIDPEGNGFALYAGGPEAAGRPEAQILGPGGEVLSSVVAPEAIALESWSQLAMTNDGETLDLYVNGELVASGGGEAVKAGDGPLLIGGEPSMEGGYFDGKIENVRIYDHARSAEEVAARQDVSPPELGLSGPLVEAAEGPLWFEDAGLEIHASDEGTASSGLKQITVQIDSEQAAVITCPCEDPEPFAYETAAWGPGPHQVTVTATDQAGNQTTRSLEADAPGAPTIVLGGPLYERRGQTIGVKSHLLKVRATETDGSAEAPRPGVAEIEVLVDGTQLGEVASQGCPLGNCGLEETWTVDPTEFAEGAHLVKVKASDLLGNETTRSFEFSIAPEDPCADSAVEPSEGCPVAAYDIEHAEEYSALPGKGLEYLADEWVKPGTQNERKVIRGGGVATRGTLECPENAELTCGQVRLLKSGEGSGSGFFVTTSEDPEDPNLETVTDLSEFHRADYEEPVATGNIEDALAPWQEAPPNHGAEYELFESIEELGEGAGVRSLWWVDSGTGLPLRRVVEFGEGSSALVIQRLYFDFDQTPIASGSVSPQFFLQEKPEGMTEVTRDVEDEPGEFEVIEEEE